MRPERGEDMNGSAFTKFHPVVNFIFFIFAIAMTVVVFHPAALAVSLVMSIITAVKFAGKKALKYFFAFPFVIMIISVILNPLFVHKGLTVMFYLGEGPVTVEALVYGACTAMMIGAVIMWSYCYSQIMTSDRFMAVFGKAAPSTSLVFSMILRFLPRAKSHAGKIAAAQDLLCAGGENAPENRKSKVKKGMRVMSVVTTWALENSIDTADSMRARGYGLAGRTMYRKYAFRGADIAAAVIMTAIAVWMFAEKAAGGWMFYAYPQIMTGSRAEAAVLSIAMALFYAVPFIIETWEDIRWNRSVSKI